MLRLWTLTAALLASVASLAVAQCPWSRKVIIIKYSTCVSIIYKARDANYIYYFDQLQQQYEIALKRIVDSVENRWQLSSKMTLKQPSMSVSLSLSLCGCWSWLIDWVIIVRDAEHQVATLHGSCSCSYNLAQELTLQCHAVDFSSLIGALQQYASDQVSLPLHPL